MTARRAVTASQDDKIGAPKRLKSLEDAHLLDTPPEVDYDRITKLVCRLLGVDTALFSIVAPDRQFFKSSCGLPSPWDKARETPLSHSFCQQVVSNDAPLVVEDAKSDPRVAGNLAIPELGVAAYLGVPVHAPNGQTLGSLCAISDKPKTWSEDAIALLRDLADIVETELRLRDKARALSMLADENGVLAREYHHRVKNALAVAASLITLSGKEATSVKDVVVKARERLYALAEAHDSLVSESDAVDLKELAARLLLPYRMPGAAADVDGPPVKLRQRQVTPICFFLHELATNSVKYGAFVEFGEVTVRWQLIDDNKISMVWDERSASIKESSTEGFGSTLIKTAAFQLGGTLDLTFHDGRILATLEFPFE